MMNNKLKQVLENYIITKEGLIYDANGKQIETFINACGYVSAQLNGYIFTVAYLVGKLYVENPNQAICIAYKDGDYTNINADNLVWYYEGEELLEDKSVLVVNEDGEVVDIFNNVTECADYFECHNITILKKCNGLVTIADDYYFFFEDNFNEKELEKRIREKENKIAINELKARQREANRIKDFDIDYFNRERKPKSKPVIEFDSNGNIITEYEGKYKMCDLLNISYPKMKRILEVTGKYNNHYFLYKSQYETIDIPEFINRIEEKERIEKEKKIKVIQPKQAKEKKIRLPKEKKIKEPHERKLKRAVKQYSMDGVYITTFYTTEELKETGYKLKNLLNCLGAKCQSTYGFRWCYEGEELKEINYIDRTILAININGEIIAEYSDGKEAIEQLNISNARSAIIKKSLINDTIILAKKSDYNEDYFEKEMKPYFENRRKINRSVLMYDSNDVLIKEFNNIKEAEKETGINYMSIFTSIKRNSRTKEFKFRYKD